ASERSEVLSPEFFLAPNGHQSPQSELAAAIHGWFAHTDDPDQHPRCRFPARYTWLATQLGLDENTHNPQPCPRFEQWARLDQIDSISVLMVSGYLGNPASSFGHSLIKFNHHSQESGARLLDISFNFGALVPPEEPTLTYIHRGLFGGYQAGFSDKLYYAQDQVYTRSEFRDIWEYELALSPAERAMLVAHLWEIAGRKFTYFFLTKNCTYRMAELLTLATGKDFTPRAVLWYVPVELFHRLEEVPQAGDDSIMADIRFIPSSQRLLYHNFARLSAGEVAIANQVITAGTGDPEPALGNLSPDRQRELLNALLAYYEYRIAAEREEPDLSTHQIKDRILRLRLSLPPSTEPEPQPPELPAPTEGHKPMLVGVGAGTIVGNTRAFVRVSPYFQDLVGASGSGDKELVVLDTQLSLDSRGNAEIDFLDIIRVRNLHTNRTAIAGESRLSWQVRLGLSRISPGDEDLSPELSAGLGRSVLLYENVLAYAMIDGVIRTKDRALRVEPNIGLAARWNTVSTEFGLAESYDIRHGNRHTRWRLDTRLPIASNREIALGMEHGQGNSMLRLALNTYW
ncbi:MAG: DUF4105 domain-containing protein, partial [Nevskiales bacterium]